MGLIGTALTETPAPPDVLDLDAGVIDDARRLQRRRRGRIAALVFAVLVAALVAHGAGGGGVPKPRTTAGDSSPITPVGHEVSFRSRRGHAEASFTMHERSGVILLAQISAPPGVRAFVDATNPYGGATRISPAGDRRDKSHWLRSSARPTACSSSW